MKSPCGALPPPSAAIVLNPCSWRGCLDLTPKSRCGALPPPSAVRDLTPKSPCGALPPPGTGFSRDGLSQVSTNSDVNDWGQKTHAQLQPPERKGSAVSAWLGDLCFLYIFTLAPQVIRRCSIALRLGLQVGAWRGETPLASFSIQV